MSSITHGLSRSFILFIITTITHKSSARMWHPVYWSKWATHHHPSLILHPFSILSTKLVHPTVVINTIIFLFTSLGWHVCHITNHIGMCVCTYNPILTSMWALVFDSRHTHTHGLFRAKPRPYQLAHMRPFFFSHSFSLYDMCHVSDHIHSCLRTPILTLFSFHLDDKCATLMRFVAI
jgi:hypothetical protein